MNNQPGFHFQHLLVLSLIFFRFLSCEALPSTSVPSSSQDVVTNFRPSLAVVVGILSFMFVLTFCFLMYIKCCNRGASSSVHGNPESQPWLIRTTSTRFSGIDKTVIESLPFFRFSSLKGSKDGLECAVCLSKFEDVEILRLLPKCKHAFHINCIDHWLEKHSSCPLCRNKVDPQDHTIFTYSNSLRLLINGGEEESNVGLFVQREEEEEEEQNNGLSSRFNFGSSFRRIMMMKGSSNSKEEESPIQKRAHDHDGDDHRKVYHKLKHKISVSDFVLQNRWSNLSSSDLMFLNSEMIGSTSSLRFGDQSLVMMNLKEDMERKVSFENKVSGVLKNNLNSPDEGRRSVSDITGVSRFGALGMKNGGKLNEGSSCLVEGIQNNNVKEEKVRKIWLPIAQRTVQWSVNREKRFLQQSLNYV